MNENNIYQNLEDVEFSEFIYIDSSKSSLRSFISTNTVDEDTRLL